MPNLHFDIRPENPDPADRDRLLAELDADNARVTGGKEGSDFAVILRSEPGAPCIGGLWAIDDYGWAFIAYLFVAGRPSK